MTENDIEISDWPVVSCFNSDAAAQLPIAAAPGALTARETWLRLWLNAKPAALND